MSDPVGKLDIVAVAEFYGADIKTVGGRSTKIRCFLPGHEDRTASAVIYLDKLYFRCFTCDASLDGLDIIQRMESCDFLSAITFAAEHPEFGDGQLSRPAAEPRRREVLRLSHRTRVDPGNNPAVQAGMRPRRKRLT